MVLLPRLQHEKLQRRAFQSVESVQARLALQRRHESPRIFREACGSQRHRVAQRRNQDLILSEWDQEGWQQELPISLHAHFHV